MSFRKYFIAHTKEPHTKHKNNNKNTPKINLSANKRTFTISAIGRKWIQKYSEKKTLQVYIRERKATEVIYGKTHSN